MDKIENLNKKFHQLQTLGEILRLLDELDINDIEAITIGSQLGQVVKLLRGAKETLNEETLDIARHELKKKERLIINNNADESSSNNQPTKKRQSSLNPNIIVVDYLKKALSDMEIFPSRKSIADFFREAFNIDYNVSKESREDLIRKLCKLLLTKNISRADIGDALLKRSSSKYGSFLKEQEDNFLKGWYQAIEKM